MADHSRTRRTGMTDAEKKRAAARRAAARRKASKKRK